MQSLSGPAGRGGYRPALEVLRAFLRLGFGSFGGPIAHLGYFREEFVARRRWIGEQGFADLVALCQFLPGPASSQVAFSLGLHRAGLAGGAAAWLGFTLPSAVLMYAFAVAAAPLVAAGPLGSAALHGLKLVAVPIVAQAVLGMARTLCPDRVRGTIAVAAALVVLAAGVAAAQLAAIAAGAVAGSALCRGPADAGHDVNIAVDRAIGWGALGAFAALLAMALLLGASAPPGLALFAAFYRAGALVFGGGHVVLPLLREALVVPGWLSDDAFLAGYGAAQAVPGPMFSVAAYLGAVARPSAGITGAATALAGIFLPGVLVLLGALPLWSRLRASVGARGALRGVNATVVGLLAVALYNPIWVTSVRSVADLALALAGFLLLAFGRAPPLAVVSLTVAGAVAVRAAGLAS
ncbi:MAG: chromate efflux transporter [Proteobacteria bacterium]|nr:chromate efflux transporter [Pseudomonadota bacterium]